MHHLLDPFSSFVITYPFLAYGVLFLCVFWEGELTLITAGILVHLHVFSLWPTIIVILVASLAKTFCGYYVGRHLGRRFPHSRLLKFFERRVFFFLPHFRDNPFWSIFVSKFVYGLNNAALVFSGYVGVAFNTYFQAEMLSTVIWFGTLFILGIFFSSTALSISHNVRLFMLLVALFVAGFMIFQKLIGLIVEVIEEWTLKEDEDLVQ